MPLFSVIFETDRRVIYSTSRIIEAATAEEAEAIGNKMLESGEVTTDELDTDYEDDEGWSVMDIWAKELNENAKETQE